MPLQICFICSEVTPLSKTGGLADVSGALLTKRPRDTVSIDYTSQDGASQSATVTLASGPAQ